MEKKDFHVALMPAIFWYSGTYNLFDQKAISKGKNLVWIIPAGQYGYLGLPTLKEKIINFYENDKIELDDHSNFPEIAAEEFEECILLHSNDLQVNPDDTILGSNVVLVRLSLSSGRDTLLFILLDHQNHCWKKVIEDYRIPLT